MNMKYCGKIREDCSSLEERLRSACKKINSKFEGKSRVSCWDLMQTELKLTVSKDEFVANKALKNQSRDAEEKVNPLLV